MNTDIREGLLRMQVPGVSRAARGFGEGGGKKRGDEKTEATQ